MNVASVSRMTPSGTQLVRKRLAALEEKEGTRPLARRLGVPFGVIRSALDGRDLKASSLEKLSDSLGLEFFIGDPRPKPPAMEPMKIDAADYDHLRLFGSVDAAAGGGAEVVDETVTGTVAFRSDWLKSRGVQSKNALMIQVRGTSMVPTIGDGHLILVNTKKNTISNGEVHVVRHEGGLYVKRLTKFGRLGVLMASDNPEFPPMFITASDFAPGSIVGQAIWSGGDIT